MKAGQDMKKKRCWLVLLVVLTACLYTGPALGASYGTAIVNGKTSDRVHLRERPAANAKSLGLYFTGTEAQCQSDPSAEWVAVTIGSQSGYMNSEYLYSGDHPAGIWPEQPQGVVQNQSAGNWVNLRDTPSPQGGVVGRLYHGGTVTVLGETATKWYYVLAGEIYGYIQADFLLLEGAASPGTVYGTAVIDGKTSDRVHLRERGSEDAKSMGLYFTGTQVVCDSDPAKQWVKVTIGSETGYMNSEYLYSGDHPAGIWPEQPKGVVQSGSAGGWVNVRAEPSQQAAVATRLSSRAEVTVLGETATKWYYVKAGDIYGYIYADYLTVGAAAP